MLAGGFNDNTIRLWDVNEASWKERAVQMANRDFEDEERRLYLKRD
jgi:hypothetical protein